MKILAGYLFTLFRPEKRLVVRFVLTSIGRTALVVAAILLIREFLAGVLGEGAGLAEALATSIGAPAALWLIAALLIVRYLGASLMTYDNQVVRQHMIKVLELG